uniref:Uncharacterized protein n=1 Tax=viral metagenome TaxID=1070528 RepID=A0A6C0I575_9ZZZZ
MSNLSLNNKIINSLNRSRYIDKLKGNIGAIKYNNRTPIHHKIIDTYEDLTSNIPTRNIIVFVSILIIVSILLYYFKPSIIMTTKKDIRSLNISSNKKPDTVISYWKFILYSIIISIIIYTILYLLKNKITYIGKLFQNNDIY